MTDQQTLTIKEAAAVLKVHPKTMEDLVKSCAIPAARVGRKYVMLARDVMSYVECQVATQTIARMQGLPRQRPVTTLRSTNSTP